MKKILLAFFTISTTFVGKGQNLVPNGDFEQVINCPTGYSQFTGFVSDWLTPTGGTPDYFNVCAAGSGVGVPDNVRGWQYAHNGDAYCGIVIARINSNPNFREYIEAPLTSTLLPGNCYHFQMYMSLADQSECTSDNIGVHFSNTLISGIASDQTLLLTPQIANMTGNYPDTMNWILMSANYTAAGGENFIIIGNFSDAANTNTVVVNANNQNYAFLFIDDVSLSLCTGIEEQNTNGEIKIYPNPVKDFLNVQILNSNFQNKNPEIKITDILGKEIYLDQFSIPIAIGTNFKFPVSNFQTGIYFIEINDGKNILRKKFLKE